MSKYILIIIWLGIMALVQMFIKCYREVKVFGVWEVRVLPFFGIVVLIPIIWMAANRGTMMDTHMYLLGFRSMPTSFDGVADYLATVEKDKGFSFLSVLIKIILGNNEVVYLLILALMQGISLFLVYRKYSESYLMSIFLFMASTDFISWMCNGLRQFIAVTTIFSVTTLMLKKKYLPVIVVILLASTFHGTAIMMLPLVFIAQGKAWNRRTMLFTAVTLLMVAYVDQFTNILDSVLYDTQYANVVNDWTSFNDDGTNPIRVLVYTAPTILAIIGRSYIKNEDDRVINFCVNMSMISTGLYIISMVTSGIFIGRLPIYASLYNYILLPWEINHFFSEKSAKVVRGSVIVLYLAFYYYQMHFGWSLF